MNQFLQVFVWGGGGFAVNFSTKKVNHSKDLLSHQDPLWRVCNIRQGKKGLLNQVLTGG